MKPPQSLPPLSLDQVAASMRRIQDMPQAEKETLCEDIFNRQSNLLAHVLVLHKLDVPIDKVDQVLHVLLVLYDLFTRATPGELPLVSEDMLDEVNQNQWALLKLMNSETPTEASRLCQLAAKSHPEVNAFAYANGTLHEAGISDTWKKEDVYCVSVVRNLVDALSRTRRIEEKETQQ